MAVNPGQQGSFSVGVFPNGQTSQQIPVDVPVGPYAIVVSDEPTNPPQACTLSNGVGTAGPSGSTGFKVDCGVGYTVGGKIDGPLGEALSLAVDNTPVPYGAVVQSNGNFTFPWLVGDGQTYGVTIFQTPPGQTCSPANNSGMISGANVTNVSITCTTAPGPGTDVVCDPWGCISLARLSYNIANILQNNVTGYVVKIGNLPSVAGGQARTSRDSAPNGEAMADSLQMDIASISKTITTIAIMQLLGKNQLTIDAQIWPFLYPNWNQTRGPNIDQITFRQLLTHTSGFGQVSIPQTNGPPLTCAAMTSYGLVKQLVQKGVAATSIGKPAYGNCNFALLRELMTGLEPHPYPTGTFNEVDNPTRGQDSLKDYVEYINKNIFSILGISTRYCPANPTVETNEILAYPYPPNAVPGNDLSGVNPGSCGDDGWSLSVADLFTVLNELATGFNERANGDTVLTAGQRLQMSSDCLGWDCATRSDCLEGNVCKNGGDGISPSQGVRTYAAIIKCDIPVVIFMNSPVPFPQQYFDNPIPMFADAYTRAEVPGAPQPCP